MMGEIDPTFRRYRGVSPFRQSYQTVQPRSRYKAVMAERARPVVSSHTPENRFHAFLPGNHRSRAAGSMKAIAEGVTHP
jgi:hypothetical protein